MGKIFVNGKFLNQPTTGVQRYAHIVSQNLSYPIISPAGSVNWLQGIWWEQISLRNKIQNTDLLINLCNTAPFNFENQIVTIHDVAVFHEPNWFSLPFRKYYKWLLPKIAHKAQSIVTVSEFSKAEIVKYLSVNPDKIKVIAPCVSSDFISEPSIKPAGFNSERFVLMVGTNDPRKNFRFAINQLQNFLKSENINLVIAGMESINFKGQALDSDAEIVRLYPSDRSLKWLYENAEVVIQPSLYEGFGLVPLEALAVGSRVLVSDIPVHREVLQGNVEYFSLNDPQDLQQKVVQLRNSNKPKSLILRDSMDVGNEWKQLISGYS